MPKYAKKLTFWEPNGDGDLVCVDSGDPAWRTVSASSVDFPMKPAQVASLMNRAFQLGMAAKSAEARQVFGLSDG